MSTNWDWGLERMRKLWSKLEPSRVSWAEGICGMSLLLTGEGIHRGIVGAEEQLLREKGGNGGAGDHRGKTLAFPPTVWSMQAG